MKISYMLKREDFYEINKNTLNGFYKDCTGEKKLYIYPELNAIVTARPSKAVRQYLYTEFRVNGSVLKRLVVRLYAGIMLCSFGLLASKTIKLKTDADENTLIYPCNKKYRVFDFRRNRVSVFAKDGFPKDDLLREIAFRREKNESFIPGLICSDDNGYSEAIIDGSPVARTGERMGALSDRAFGIWSDYIMTYTRQMCAKEYAAVLENRLVELKRQARTLGKDIEIKLLDHLSGELLTVLRAENAHIPISLSHGDLQPGNIWVEHHTDKLYIIDWESWDERSTWYDHAVLYEQLRKTDGIMVYAQQRDLVHATVLLEDVIFRLRELTTLPLDYGSKEFNGYIKSIQGGNTDV